MKRLAFFLFSGFIVLLSSHELSAIDGAPVTRLRPGVFLFSVPEMRDPNFSQTVVLLVDHERAGATGVIINRPTEIPLEKALPDIEGIQGKHALLYFGGPVSRHRVLVLFRSDRPIEGAIKVLGDVYFTADADILARETKKSGSQHRIRVYAGYAGWAPGQLEHEIARGDWVVGPGDAEMVFSKDPAQVWPKIFTLQEQIEIQDPPKGIGPAHRDRPSTQRT